MKQIVVLCIFSLFAKDAQTLLLSQMDWKNLRNSGALDLNVLRCFLRDKNYCPSPHIDHRLYAPNGPRRGIPLNVKNPMSLYKGGFSKHRETVFIIHGFNGTAIDIHLQFLRDGDLLIPRFQCHHSGLATSDPLSVLPPLANQHQINGAVHRSNLRLSHPLRSCSGADHMRGSLPGRPHLRHDQQPLDAETVPHHWIGSRTASNRAHEEQQVPVVHRRCQRYPGDPHQCRIPGPRGQLRAPQLLRQRWTHPAVLQRKSNQKISVLALLEHLLLGHCHVQAQEVHGSAVSQWLPESQWIQEAASKWKSESLRVRLAAKGVPHRQRCPR
ncbi:uncharacterized protein Dere_GG23668, isoform B [Drosophila erecta]|uniref:Uncharacterized protein, isoform B n=1 Tax=Drosophila erecta TaxID=7220 RepID=A0A0Q5WAU1_DROER|nr:uncharacterized protein Dere_GG23668, isoform B [Drosophila erecta]